MGKKKLLHPLGFMTLIMLITAIVACNKYTAFASTTVNNTKKPDQKYYDEIQNSLRKIPAQSWVNV